MYIIVGLGNPGKEYEGSRHNIGREVVEQFAKKVLGADFVEVGKKSAYVAEGKIGKEEVVCVLPEVYMNQSGGVAKLFATSKKKIENMILVHDDLDRGLGDVNISFNKGTGGHRGVESVAKKLATKAFMRLRLGISRKTPKGAVRKVKGEEAVKKFVLGKFGKTEEADKKKVLKKGVEALEAIVRDGRLKAMNKVN